MDLKSYSRWYDYSRARDAMFAATDTAWAPWYIADTDDKKRGRLDIISHLLSQIPYKPLAPRNITLPQTTARPAATPNPTCHCSTFRHRSSRLGRWREGRRSSLTSAGEKGRSSVQVDQNQVLERNHH